MNKKQMIYALAIAFFVAGGATTTFASEKTNTNFGVEYWKPSLSSNIKAGTGGTTVDLKNDLGLPDQNTKDFTLNFDKLRVGYTSFDFKGDKTLTNDFNFQGKNYTASSEVASQLKMDYYRVGFVNNISSDKTGKTDFIVELKGLKLNTSINDKTHSMSDEKSVNAIIPTIGFRTEQQVDKSFVVYGEATGMIAGRHGHIYDAELGFRYGSKTNNVTGGYRVFDLSVKNGDDSADIKLSGPFFSYNINF